MADMNGGFHWERLGYEYEALVNADGEILGEIRGGYRTVSAIVGTVLGRYITEEHAKRAVEKRLRLGRIP